MPSVESFGPELMTALLEGSKARFVIPGLSYRNCVKFRQRIYQLRKAMIDAKHEAVTSVARTRIQIVWPQDTPTHKSRKGLKWPTDRSTICDLIISPHDSEFADALKRAGIKSPDLIDDVLETPKTSSPSALKGFEPEP